MTVIPGPAPAPAAAPPPPTTTHTLFSRDVCQSQEMTKIMVKKSEFRQSVGNAHVWNTKVIQSQSRHDLFIVGKIFKFTDC